VLRGRPCSTVAQDSCTSIGDIACSSSNPNLVHRLLVTTGMRWFGGLCVTALYVNLSITHHSTKHRPGPSSATHPLQLGYSLRPLLSGRPGILTTTSSRQLRIAKMYARQMSTAQHPGVQPTIPVHTRLSDVRSLPVLANCSKRGSTLMPALRQEGASGG
jgi:hypothetical protein